MSKVQHLETKVQSLSPQELSLFRAWFVEYDAQGWDRQIEADQKSGNLNAIVDKARAEFKSGNTREI